MPVAVLRPSGAAVAALLAALAGAAPLRAQPAHPSPAADLARARLMLAVGNRDGEALWWRAVASDDPAIAPALRADLRLLATDAELRELDALSGAARADWLHRFWGRRAAASLERERDRLGEHYRRLAWATKYYGQPTDARGLPFDDRGVVYVKHGAPTEVRGPALLPSDDATRDGELVVVPNMVWRYARADGDLVLWFRGCAERDPFDGRPRLARSCTPASARYELVESPDDLLVHATGLRGVSPDASRDLPRRATGIAPDLALRGRARVGGAGGGQLLLPTSGEAAGRDGQSEAQLAARTLNPGTEGSLGAQALRDRWLGRQDVRRALRFDSDEPRHLRPLEGRLRLVRLGRDGDRALLHLAFAVDAARLDPIARGDVLYYPVRMRAVLLDSTGAPIVQVDTARLWRADERLGAGTVLLGTFTFAAPPGAWQWRAALERDDTTGLATALAPLVVPPVAGRFTLSDLALAPASAPRLVLPGTGDTLHLSGAGAVSGGEPVELFAQVTGAMPGESLDVVLTLTREGGVFGGGRALEVRGTERVRGETHAIVRVLDLARLKAGRYEVALAVTRADGARVVTATPLELRTR